MHCASGPSSCPFCCLERRHSPLFWVFSGICLSFAPSHYWEWLQMGRTVCTVHTDTCKTLCTPLADFDRASHEPSCHRPTRKVHGVLLDPCTTGPLDFLIEVTDALTLVGAKAHDASLPFPLTRPTFPGRGDPLAAVPRSSGVARRVHLLLFCSIVSHRGEAACKPYCESLKNIVFGATSSYTTVL